MRSAGGALAGHQSPPGLMLGLAPTPLGRAEFLRGKRTACQSRKVPRRAAAVAVHVSDSPNSCRAFSFVSQPLISKVRGVRSGKDPTLPTLSLPLGAPNPCHRVRTASSTSFPEPTSHPPSPKCAFLKPLSQFRSFLDEGELPRAFPRNKRSKGCLGFLTPEPLCFHTQRICPPPQGHLVPLPAVRSSGQASQQG